MSSSIQDVVIKISLQAGDLSAAKSIAKEIEDAFKNISPLSTGNSSGLSRAKATKGGKSPEELAKKEADAKIKADEKASREAEKAYDREAAAAVRSYSKIMAERRRVAKEAEVQSDREAAAAVRSYSKIMAERRSAEQKSAAEAASKQSAANARQQSLIGGAKGAALLVASQTEGSEKLVQAIAATEGLYQVSTTLTTALGAQALAFVPLIGELVMYAHAAGEARRMTEEYWKSMHSDASRAVTAQTTATSRQMSSALWMSRELPDTSSSKVTIHSMHNQAGREKRLREMEARVDLTPEQKSERRAFTEGQAGLEEQRAGKSYESSQINRRLAYLREGSAGIAEQQQSIRDRYRNVRSSLKNEHAEIVAKPGWFGRYTKEQMDRMGDIKTQHAGSQVQEQEDLVKSQKELAAIKREELALGQQQVQNLASQFQITKQMQQSAYEAVRNEKQAARQGLLSFGRMSKGDQAHELRIQAKHKRIEAQKAAGVTADKLERYTQEELMRGGNGNIAEVTMEEQAIREAEASGVEKRHSAKTVKEKEAQAAGIDKDAESQASELQKLAAQQAIENEKAEDKLFEVMKSVITGDKRYDNLIEKFEAFKSQLESDKVQRGFWY